MDPPPSPAHSGRGITVRTEACSPHDSGVSLSHSAHSLGKRSQIPQTSLVSPRQHRGCGGLGSGSSVCPGPTPSSPPRSLALRERECWAWAPGRKADSGRTGKALFPGFAVSALVWLMDKGPFQGREQLPTLLTLLCHQGSLGCRSWEGSGRWGQSCPWGEPLITGFLCSHKPSAPASGLRGHGHHQVSQTQSPLTPPSFQAGLPDRLDSVGLSLGRVGGAGGEGLGRSGQVRGVCPHPSITNKSPTSSPTSGPPGASAHPPFIAWDHSPWGLPPPSSPVHTGFLLTPKPPHMYPLTSNAVLSPLPELLGVPQCPVQISPPVTPSFPPPSALRFSVPPLKLSKVPLHGTCFISPEALVLTPERTPSRG